jgi:feruloyl-CoA synthase
LAFGIACCAQGHSALMTTAQTAMNNLPVLDVRFGGCLRAELHTRTDGSVLMQSTEALQTHAVRLSDRLLEQAHCTPDRVFAAQLGPARSASAAAAPSPWRTLTYRQMLARARAVGQWLLNQGLSAERPVAILSGNDLEHLTLSMGALWVGVPWVPVSPAYSLLSTDHGKLRHILRVTTPGLVFAASADYLAAISAAAPADAAVLMPDAAAASLTPAALGGRPLLAFSDLLHTEAKPACDAAQAATGPDTIVKFLFTSGSTKDPKGVVNTNRMICANQQMLRQTLAFVADEPPVLVDWLPWNHTFGGNHNVGIVLYNGGTLYIDEGKPTAKGMQQTLANLREVAPTMYFNVPKGFEELATAMEDDPALRDHFFSRVQCFMYAGAGLSQAVWNRIDALAVAARGAKVPMITGLGMTETAPSCMFAVGGHVRSGHIGLPCPGVQLKLVPNAEGSGKTEVRFRGPNVMPGYWRAPQQTAAAFDEEGYYRTGDAAVWIDPAHPQKGLAFDGRIAEDFKLSSGTFVSVGPLRAAVIAAGEPLVQDAVVAGIDRDDLGLMIFPRLEEARRVFGFDADAPASAVLSSAPAMAFFQDLLNRLWRAGTGSANRPARLLLLHEPPQIDRGEVTDKGSINQRAVLANRADLVAHLWGEAARSDGLAAVLRPHGA